MISAFRRQRQAICLCMEFLASLIYTGRPCLTKRRGEGRGGREIAAGLWCPTSNIWVTLVSNHYLNLLSPNNVLVCITFKFFSVCLISSNRRAFSLSIYLANKCENRLDLNPFSRHVAAYTPSSNWRRQQCSSSSACFYFISPREVSVVAASSPWFPKPWPCPGYCLNIFIKAAETLMQAPSLTVIQCFCPVISLTLS